MHAMASLAIDSASDDLPPPTDDRAKLMYYLKCVCSWIAIDEEIPVVNKLTNYLHYQNLSEDEVRSLRTLCELYSPEELDRRKTASIEGSSSTASFLKLRMKTIDGDKTETTIPISGAYSRTEKLPELQGMWQEWVDKYYYEPIKRLKDQETRKCELQSERLEQLMQEEQEARKEKDRIRADEEENYEKEVFEKAYQEQLRCIKRQQSELQRRRDRQTLAEKVDVHARPSDVQTQQQKGKEAKNEEESTMVDKITTGCWKALTWIPEKIWLMNKDSGTTQKVVGDHQEFTEEDKVPAVKKSEENARLEERDKIGQQRKSEKEIQDEAIAKAQEQTKAAEEEIEKQLAKDREEKQKQLKYEAENEHLEKAKAEKAQEESRGFWRRLFNQ